MSSAVSVAGDPSLDTVPGAWAADAAASYSMVGTVSGKQARIPAAVCTGIHPPGSLA